MIIINLSELEKIKHGSADFPIALYRVTSDFPRYRMMCHWHVEYELIRIISGSLALKIDEKDFNLRAGDAILIHGGNLHSGEPEDCIYECLVFGVNPITSLAGCREELSPILANDVFISHPYRYETDREIRLAIDGFFDAVLGEKKGYKLAAVSYLYQIFSIIIEKEAYGEKNNCVSIPENRYIVSFKKVITWLEAHYNENITLDDLAEVAGFSPKYFCRLFSRLTGRSPIDYLNCYRVDRASEMLTETEKSIIDIAAECGFYDLSYFVKVFKKYKGIPPGQYRKRTGA